MEPTSRPPAWKWAVCGLLFLATMMMYMDRQTLATMAKRICDELHLSNEQYGQLEMGFGLAFAVGAIVNGLIADRVSIRWFYPFVLIGWSVMGMATAYGVEIGEVFLGWADFFQAGFDSGFGAEWLPPEHPQQRPAFVGLMFCRVLLGFFESGHWPCALIITQRIISANDRTFGNSLLQSGASVGAVLTPLAVWAILSNELGAWRGPFVIIGVIGILWIIPWFLLVRGSDLARQTTLVEGKAKPDAKVAEPESLVWVRRSLVLLAVVIPINFTWQFFRAWLAKMLQEQHQYSEQEVLGFTSLYYLVADMGCIAVGVAVKGMTAHGWHRHSARTLAFTICTALCLLGVFAAYLPKGWPLLGVLLAVGFGSLGMFPIYYSLTQEMSKKHQGLVSGILGFTTWVTFALAQPPLGRLVDATKSYNTAILWIVQLPILACFALTFFWGRSSKDETPSVGQP